MSRHIYLLPSKQIAELLRPQILSRRATRIKIGHLENNKNSIDAEDLIPISDRIDISCYTDKLESHKNVFSEIGKVVTIGIREPKSLILNSFWNSYHENNSTLEIFIESQIKCKSLFLSKIYENWSENSGRCIFLPIDRQNSDQDLHSIPLQLFDLSIKAALTYEPDLLENMYSATLIASAQPFLVRATSIGASVMDDSLIERLFLASIRSRPFYEYSKKFNLTQLELCGAISRIIPKSLKKFVDEWHVDAENFLQENAENTDLNLIKNSLPFYKDEACGNFFVPTDNFAKLLPLTSEFSILTRILAAGVNTY